MRLEGRNILGVDAVLEVAAKAGIEAIDGLVACRIAGDNVPGADQPFADRRGQGDRHGALGKFDKTLERDVAAVEMKLLHQ